MQNNYRYIYWLVGAYIGIVWVCSLTKVSSYKIPLFNWLGDHIPSIFQLSQLAHDINKATFELGLAWIMSFVIAYFFIKKANWKYFVEKSHQAGGRVKTALKLFLCSILSIFVVTYPITPSPTGRFGKLLLATLRNDFVYIWGVAIIFTTILALMSLIIGIYLILLPILSATNK